MQLVINALLASLIISVALLLWPAVLIDRNVHRLFNLLHWVCSKLHSRLSLGRVEHLLYSRQNRVLKHTPAEWAAESCIQQSSQGATRNHSMVNGFGLCIGSQRAHVTICQGKD